MSRVLKRFLTLLSISFFIFLISSNRSVSSENYKTENKDNTKDPFLGKKYLGIDVCEICHPGKIKGWKTTAHSNAFSLLEAIGQDENDTCLRCHTTGFNESVKNGGYDEIRSKELINVQCEACHQAGASVGHGESRKSSYKSSIIAYSRACGYCHTKTVKGSRSQGEFDQWKNSKHKNVSVGCPSCHFPHSAKNTFQLKFFGDIKLANGTEVKADIAAMCMKCHSDKIKNADISAEAEKMPQKPQAEMFSGTGGGGYGGETHSSSYHTTDSFKISGKDAREKCVTCHMYDTPAKGEAGNNTVGQHSFAMRDKNDNINIKACQQSGCHSASSVPNFDRKAFVDYDGDGTKEGVQTEIEGLLEKLKGAIVVGGNIVFSDSSGEPEFEVSSSATSGEKKAVFNWLFIYNDGSRGIHNTAYAVKLLQVSYKKLTE